MTGDDNGRSMTGNTFGATIVKSADDWVNYEDKITPDTLNNSVNNPNWTSLLQFTTSSHNVLINDTILIKLTDATDPKKTLTYSFVLNEDMWNAGGGAYLGWQYVSNNGSITQHKYRDLGSILVRNFANKQGSSYTSMPALSYRKAAWDGAKPIDHIYSILDIFDGHPTPSTGSPESKALTLALRADGFGNDGFYFSFNTGKTGLALRTIGSTTFTA